MTDGSPQYTQKQMPAREKYFSSRTNWPRINLVNELEGF